ncbi:MAG: hypothetical protein J5757_09930 [Lachnospiraceae bacterium]|nr:hypothetical protein [Lachnospiraceae bacterium]
MKKRLSILLVTTLLLTCLTTLVWADDKDLPYEIAAPQNVAVIWIEGNDSPTTMSFSYSIPNDMAKFYKDMEDPDTAEALRAKYAFETVWCFVQIDWAIDDVNDSVSGWHYNEYWTDRGDYGIRYDEEYRIRTSEWDMPDWALGNATETAQTAWILRGVPDDTRWNGDPENKTPGVKDQLNPDQYEYYDDTVHIDFTKHTAYFRARLVTVVSKATEDGDVSEYYYSDWSDTCGYGKDIAAIEILKPSDVAAPVITDLRITADVYDENPVAEFTLTVPETLQKQVTDVSTHGSISVYTEARVKGDSEWTHVDGDRDVKPGALRAYLSYLVNDERPTIPKDTPLELRCRYYVSQYSPYTSLEVEDFYTDYSNVITFETEEINADKPTYDATTVAPATEIAPTNPPAPTTEEKDECWLCHFCPQPLGLCIFIWLLIILVIAAVVIVVVVMQKKKKKDEKK